MSKIAAAIKNVSFQYQNGDQNALNDIDLTIIKGECVLLCGGSGCGKTTVTRLLNGLIPHYYEGNLDGETTVFGRNIVDTPIEELAGTVSSVFQNPRSQFFCVDTTTEIAFGCENMGLPEEDIRKRVEETVSKMHINDLLDRSIFKLSGGEKQKIACAGAAAMQPDIFVLDEPTSNLDIDSIEQLKGILRLWKKSGKTIVIAEHRLGWLSSLCDRVIFMENGRIKKEYDGSSFFSFDSDNLASIGLRSFTCPNNYFDGKTGLYAIKESAAKENMILNDFYFRYGRTPALNIKMLSIPTHAVIAVTGHNGAGKSTFVRCLCGLHRGFKGEIIIDGIAYNSRKMRKISYMVMQDVNHQLFAETVLEEVMLGAIENNEASALAILKSLGIEQYKHRHPMSLSAGQKQRVAIASALLAQKRLLVFDEPTSGLDFKSMEATAELLRSISFDCTVFIVTHDPELIDRCCTHVLHIENGKI